MKSKLFRLVTGIGFLASVICEYSLDLDFPMTPALWLTLAAIAFVATPLSAALTTNSWNTSSSGKWEIAANWSAGMPTNSDAANLITKSCNHREEIDMAPRSERQPLVGRLDPSDGSGSGYREYCGGSPLNRPDRTPSPLNAKRNFLSVSVWVWGDIPEGFAKQAEGRYWAVIRKGLELAFPPESFGRPPRSDEASSYQGRALLRQVKLPDGGNGLVRSYLHGGLFGFFTGKNFFTWPPRPFRELAITVELQRRGIPTVEVCAAAIERLPGPFYRGWFATRELAGAQDLWAVLQGNIAREEGLDNILRAVASSLRCLHREGVCHGDLNLKNILVRRESKSLKAYIIDFDKASLFLGPVPQPIASRNLERLLRSVRKLDVQRQYLSESDWNKFVSCYHGATV